MSDDLHLIRRAELRDTDAMLEITRSIWDGNDYVPYVWHRWLGEPVGYLSVCEIDGDIAGFQHVELQHDGTAWFEGIGVREGLQSRGVGRALLDDGREWAVRAGASRIRLSTYGANPASNRIAIKAGLREVARLAALQSTPGAEDEPVGCRPALPHEAEAIFDCVCAAGLSTPIYSEGWIARSLSVERLRQLIAAHHVAVRGTTRIDAVVIVTGSRTHPVARIGLLVGDSDELIQLVRWVRVRAASAGTSVSALPEASAHRELLLANGFTWPDRAEMVVYERSL